MLRKLTSCFHSFQSSIATRNAIVDKLRATAVSSKIMGTSQSGIELSGIELRELDNALMSGSLSASEISSIAWSLGKLAILDPHCWSGVIGSLSQSAEFRPADLAITTFALASVVKMDSTLLQGEIRNRLGAVLHKLASSQSDINRTNLADAAQLSYGVSKLFPHSPLITPYVSRSVALLTSLPRCPEGVPVIESCRELGLLWSVARLRRDTHNRTSRDLVEALLDASRGLRNCSDFNQNKVAQIADTLRVLKISDNRIIFQLIHFLDKKSQSINAKNLMRIAACLGELKIDNPIAWRRIAKRIESPLGVKLGISDLELLARYIIKFGPPGVSQRSSGIISLYIKTKTDAYMYGDVSDS